MKPRLRIVLQARLSSTRLPAKVLLPVGGLPLVVLAARRAGRSGGELVVATSDAASDDLVAWHCGSAGLPVHRGSLGDVLSRHVGATADMADHDLCVRATADNALPDATFLDDLAGLRDALDVPYLGYGAGGAGLPHGLSAEIFTVRVLREAHAAARDPYDREHVTPWIAARYALRDRPAFPGSDAAFDGVRCTIDDLDDYIGVVRAFAAFDDPIAAPWRDLAAVLARRNVGSRDADASA